MDNRKVNGLRTEEFLVTDEGPGVVPGNTRRSVIHDVGGSGPDEAKLPVLLPDPEGQVAEPAVPGRAVHDRVRWGPVWSGLLVTLSTFAVLELTFFALGWLDLDRSQNATTAGWMSGLIGLVAFFLGGAAAAATAMWRGAGDGILHGVLVWALTTVGIVFLTVFGGGALFGSLADVFTQVASLRSPNVPELQAFQLLTSARTAAAWAVFGSGLTVAAAAVGGATGAKLWPSKNQAVQPTAPRAGASAVETRDRDRTSLS